MKKVITVFSTIILLFFCTSCKGSKNKHLTYQNIVILSDMSDRLKPLINGNTPNQQYPPKDVQEIHKIVEYFKNECVKPGKKIGDKSSISFSTFSGKALVSIDIDQIKNLGDKQSFVNSTGKYKNNGLEQKLKDFENTVKRLYERINNSGLDLISMLIEKIENEPIIKQNIIIANGLDTTFTNYENHIYIFTDGYLEYKTANTSRQFYFGALEIQKVRQYCITHKVNIKTALEKDKSLCLPFCRSEKNQHINLHILETHERDKNTEFQTYKYSKGLRDNEILEAVWRKWAKESGFKSFEWKKY